VGGRKAKEGASETCQKACVVDEEMRGRETEPGDTSRAEREPKVASMLCGLKAFGLGWGPVQKN